MRGRLLLAVVAVAALGACALFDDEVPSPSPPAYLVELQRIGAARKCADACMEKDCTDEFQELREARNDPAHPERLTRAAERADLCECTCSTRCGHPCTNLARPVGGGGRP